MAASRKMKRRRRIHQREGELHAQPLLPSAGHIRPWPRGSCSSWSMTDGLIDPVDIEIVRWETCSLISARTTLPPCAGRDDDQLALVGAWQSAPASARRTATLSLAVTLASMRLSLQVEHEDAGKPAQRRVAGDAAHEGRRGRCRTAPSAGRGRRRSRPRRRASSRHGRAYRPRRR